jgi:mono/diheme cytochrome c family protein
MVLRLIVVFFLLSACGENTQVVDFDNEKPFSQADAKALYSIHCAVCHGVDGKLGLSNAADLSESKISDVEVKNVILNGNEKGMMPYKELITKENQVDALVEYTKSLRK